jgi:hypothetical protein
MSFHVYHPETRCMVSLVLPQEVQHEIARIAQNGQIDVPCLEKFAYLVLQIAYQDYSQGNHLTIDELKTAIYRRFKVTNTKELKQSGAFKLATEGLEIPDFRLKSTWEMLYRRFIDILPHEREQQGYGCINGVNIFDYFKPWQVFDLDPKTATKQDIKNAYYRLSKIYHPDNPETGDRMIFERIDLMYKSLIFEI